MSDGDIEQARRWFAEELRFVARVGDPRGCRVLADMQRQRFVRTGPLQILSSWNVEEIWTPPNSAPRPVSHDVLIAYDEPRWLNNGQPSLWAFVFDEHVAAGEHVIHLGCGMGYSRSGPGGSGGARRRDYGDRDR